MNTKSLLITDLEEKLRAGVSTNYFNIPPVKINLQKVKSQSEIKKEKKRKLKRKMARNSRKRNR